MTAKEELEANFKGESSEVALYLAISKQILKAFSCDSKYMDGE